MTNPFLSIFIPAYNAEKTLANVIERIPSNLWTDIGLVAIVNDGSRDQTEKVALDLVKNNPKIIVHTFETNRGYGHAVRQGIEFCRKSASQYSLCLHADGQYPPEKLVQFLDYMKKNQIDILQGSRHLSGGAKAGGMPNYKIWAGKLLTRLENKCFHLSLTDYHSGFLIYSSRALQQIPFEGLSHYFDFDLEVIACARARDFKIHELAIPTRYADEKSYLNPIRYGLKTLKVMLRYKLGKYHQTPL